MSCEIVPCDLCGDSQFEILGKLDRDGNPLTTRICRKCGLVAHLKIPSESELQDYYAATYRRDYHGESQPSARRVMRAWVNGQRILHQVTPFLHARSKVLEVGAGIGATVKCFQREGFAAVGIDPGGEFATFAQDSLKSSVEIRSLYELRDRSDHDAILLVHVIEHLASPRLAVAKLGELLKPGGLLYVECPNLQAPFAHRPRLFHRAHIHNFTPTTLKALVESCGFKLRQRFGDESNPNLQMLFQHTGVSELNIPGGNYEQTLADLKQSDWVPYHLRVRYLTERIQKLASYLREHLQATSFLRKLVAECASEMGGPDSGAGPDSKSASHPVRKAG